MSAVLLLIATLLAPAHAGSTTVSSYEQAEYYRLTQELHALARRQAWDGVERAYASILQLSVPPSFDDLKVAAHAAGARGDTWAARERLEAAHDLAEDREVIDWMWEIDTSYVEVHIQAPTGTPLAAEKMPFDPHQFMAVAFAMSEIEQDGDYVGYLPAGIYQLGEEIFEVRVGDPPLTLDRLPDEDDAARQKKHKKGR